MDGGWTGGWTGGPMVDVSGDGHADVASVKVAILLIQTFTCFNDYNISPTKGTLLSWVLFQWPLIANVCISSCQSDPSLEARAISIYYSG